MREDVGFWDLDGWGPWGCAMILILEGERVGKAKFSLRIRICVRLFMILGTPSGMSSCDPVQTTTG
jgi:hypothetical protein